MKCKHEGCYNEARTENRYRPALGTHVFVQRTECPSCINSRYNYGINTPERNKLLASQDYKCACCGSPIDFLGKQNSTSKHNAVVDHCHTNGHVRGILCGACNIMLGIAGDSITLLNKAISYLERNKND